MLVGFIGKQVRKKTMVSRKLELDTLAKLEVATAHLHGDINNFEKQGEVNRLRELIGKIETRKAKGAALRSRTKWLQVGDRCSKEFFQAVRPRNAQAAISELKDKSGRIFIKREDLERITKDFYEELYAHKEVSEEALARVIEGVPALFTNSMNKALDKKITER